MLNFNRFNAVDPFDAIVKSLKLKMESDIPAGKEQKRNHEQETQKPLNLPDTSL